MSGSVIGIYCPDQHNGKKLQESLGRMLPSDCRFHLFSPDSIRDKNDLRGLEAIFFPGARSITPYERSWRPELTEIFDNYVMGGGKLFKICAASYLAGEKLEFSDQVARPTNFMTTFNGSARGPINLPGHLEKWRFETVELYLNNGATVIAPYLQGPFFELDEDTENNNVSVIARYHGPDGPIAAMMVKRGRGCIYLSGPHLEFHPDDFFKMAKFGGGQDMSPDQLLKIGHSINHVGFWHELLATALGHNTDHDINSLGSKGTTNKLQQMAFK